MGNARGKASLFVVFLCAVGLTPASYARGFFQRLFHPFRPAPCPTFIRQGGFQPGFNGFPGGFNGGFNQGFPGGFNQGFPGGFDPNFGFNNGFNQGFLNGQGSFLDQGIGFGGGFIDQGLFGQGIGGGVQDGRTQIQDPFLNNGSLLGNGTLTSVFGQQSVIVNGVRWNCPNGFVFAPNGFFCVPQGSFPGGVGGTGGGSVVGGGSVIGGGNVVGGGSAVGGSVVGGGTGSTSVGTASPGPFHLTFPGPRFPCPPGTRVQNGRFCIINERLALELQSFDGRVSRANFVELVNGVAKPLRIGSNGTLFDHTDGRVTLDLRRFFLNNENLFRNAKTVVDFLGRHRDEKSVGQDMVEIGGQYFARDTANNLVPIRFDDKGGIEAQPGAGTPRVAIEELNKQLRPYHDKKLKSGEIEHSNLNKTLKYLYPNLRVDANGEVVEWTADKKNSEFKIEDDKEKHPHELGRITGTTRPETIDQLRRLFTGNDAIVKDDASKAAGLAKYYDKSKWVIPREGRYDKLRLIGEPPFGEIFEYLKDPIHGDTIRELRVSEKNKGEVTWLKDPEALKQLVWYYRWLLKDCAKAKKGGKESACPFDAKEGDDDAAKTKKAEDRKLSEEIVAFYEGKIPVEKGEGTPDREIAEDTHEDNHDEVVPPEPGPSDIDETAAPSRRLSRHGYPSRGIRRGGTHDDHAGEDESPVSHRHRRIGAARANARAETKLLAGLGRIRFVNEDGSAAGTCSGALLKSGLFATAKTCFKRLQKGAYPTAIEFVTEGGETKEVDLDSSDAKNEVSYDSRNNELAYVHFDPKQSAGIAPVTKTWAPALKEETEPMSLQIVGFQKRNSLTKVASQGCRIEAWGEHRSGLGSSVVSTNCKSWGDGGVVLGTTNTGRKVLLGFVVNDVNCAEHELGKDSFGSYRRSTDFTPLSQASRLASLIESE